MDQLNAHPALKNAMQKNPLSDGDPILSPINELISLNQDIARLYDTAAEALKDAEPTQLKLLQDNATHRRSMAADLIAVVVSKSEEPETGGTFQGLLQRVWLTLRGLINGGEAAPIFAECAGADDILIQAYAEAVANKVMPAQIRQMLREHLSQLRANHVRISGLAAALAA